MKLLLFENVTSDKIIFYKRQMLYNKKGLQYVSRPVEQVHHFGGQVQGAKSLWCQGFADRQTYRTCGSTICIKVGTKVGRSLM